jgi:hypothetical protein
MTKDRLLILASESKMLRNLAAKLCNYRDIQHDLFQEFILILCETDEKILIDKYNNAQFIGFCYLNLKSLNLNRLTANNLVNTKNPLAEKRNVYEIDNLELIDEDYNHEIDVKFEKVIKFVKKDKFKSEILFKSVVKSTREIAQDLGLNQRKLIYENVKFKKQIKKYFERDLEKD